MRHALEVRLLVHEIWVNPSIYHFIIDQVTIPSILNSASNEKAAKMSLNMLYKFGSGSQIHYPAIVVTRANRELEKEDVRTG